MIKSIEVRNLGDVKNQKMVIELGAPETTGLWVKSLKGIGPGKATINVTDLASSDGGIYNSSRSETRNITITLGITDFYLNNQYYSVEENRRKLYTFFRKKNNILFIVHTDKVDYQIEGYVESCEPNIFSKNETVDVSIICPDPNWYPVDSSKSSSFSATEDAFEFPDNYEGDGYENEVLYVPTEDTSMQPGKTYYELDDNHEYVETSDPSFIEGKTYYEQMTEYFETEDTTFVPGKRYYNYDEETDSYYPTSDSTYVGYFVTQDETMQAGKTYYELVEGQYVETQDQSFQEGKIYYEKNTYYEYRDRTILADIVLMDSNYLTYDGEITTGLYIDIYMTGEVSGITLYKSISDYDDETISISDSKIFSNQSISGPDFLCGGDEIHICTIPGKKSAYFVREGQAFNIMNALGRDPDWFLLDIGFNEFKYSATSGAEYIYVSLNYVEAYEGI